MKISKRVLPAAAAVLAMAAPAIAGHGKVGLWNITITMQMAGMPEMPDMSKLPPQAQAALRARGMTMSGGHSMTVTHCMTAAEVNADHPKMSNTKECKISNAKIAGNTFSGDMTCTGDMNATGHMEFVWDSPEHYRGKQTLTGTSHGHAINTTNTFEGRWVSAVCKGTDG